MGFGRLLTDMVIIGGVLLLLYLAMFAALQVRRFLRRIGLYR